MFLPDTHSGRQPDTACPEKLSYFCCGAGGCFSLSFFSEGKRGSLQLPLECTYGQSGGKMGGLRVVWGAEHMAPSVTLLERDGGRKWAALYMHSLYEGNFENRD